MHILWGQLSTLSYPTESCGTLVSGATVVQCVIVVPIREWKWRLFHPSVCPQQGGGQGSELILCCLRQAEYQDV